MEETNVSHVLVCSSVRNIHLWKILDKQTNHYKKLEFISKLLIESKQFMMIPEFSTHNLPKKMLRE